MKNQIGMVKSFEKRADVRNGKAVDWLTAFLFSCALTLFSSSVHAWYDMIDDMISYDLT